MAEKRSYKELWDKIQSAKPTNGTTWRHYKSRSHYVVVGLAIEEASQEPVVIYHCIDGRSGPMVWFTRPLREWEEEVSPGVKRFTRV